MPTQISGITGPSVLTDGSGLPFRQERSGALVTQSLHGRYFESTFRRAIYSGSVVGQATTVGLNTTYTGLCLSNTLGSTVNLAINKVGYAFIVAFPAGSVIGLMTGSAVTNVAHTTPVVPRSQFFNSAASGLGLLDSSATLPAAPTLNLILGAGLTGAITTGTSGASGLVDLEGSIVLPPGSFCAFYTSTASGLAAGAFSFQWEEIAV